MDSANTTCWTMIAGAAQGREADRSAFAERYLPVVRAYLQARWRGHAWRGGLDDAVQQVFVECFRGEGVLNRAAQDRAGGFRAFLYGVSRNVALRVETKQGRRPERQADTGVVEQHVDPSEAALSQVFDREWARAIMSEAARRQSEMASEAGAEAVRRVELLRLRFHEGLAIRDIAARWGDDPVLVHREYAKARKEFKHALLEVMAFHDPEAQAGAERECARLLALLG